MMKWTKEAEEAVSRVPFFIRKKVRKKVEEEAGRAGGPPVTLDHVQSCQKRFLKNMDQDVKGYQVETCFGPSGCPNQAVDSTGLPQEIEQALQSRDLRSFLKSRVQGPLKMHHDFRVSLSCCPNACSRPQIVDFGIVGVQTPRLTEKDCTRCGACLEVCQEGALHLKDEEERPNFEEAACLSCGQCIPVCPTGTLQKGKQGFRLLIGGKLGRHPQLGKDLGKIHTREEVLRALNHYLDLYQTHCRKGERLGEILNRQESP
jgi:anaerobic sulfite reductase subunit C